RPGRNDVRVSDGAGHEDSAVVYYAPAGAPPAGEARSLVRGLVSSNQRSPAWFVDQPVQEQWPFYWEFDATADNTFDVLPQAVRGAGWITTRRLSKPDARTDLSFTAGAGARVFVMGTEAAGLEAALLRAGFRDASVRGLWRDHQLRRVPFRLYAKDVREG